LKNLGGEWGQLPASLACLTIYLVNLLARHEGRKVGAGEGNRTFISHFTKLKRTLFKALNGQQNTKQVKTGWFVA
jgi:hypothetical protein